jgi:hypothetical protein
MLLQSKEEVLETTSNVPGKVVNPNWLPQLPSKKRCQSNKNLEAMINITNAQFPK